MRLHFTQCAMPEGAELWVHAPYDLENAFGPFGGTGIYPTGEFWCETIRGDAVVVEYREPKAGAGNKLPFRIADVVWVYRDDLEPTESLLGSSCEQDATCFSGYAFEGDAVGQMTFVDGGQSWVCTGTLLNTNAGDLTPWFLTANHCIANNTVANTLDVTWFYETPTCNGTPPDPSTLPHSLGATYYEGRSRSALSDFTLLLIDGALPGGVVWSGWTTATPAAADFVAGIHHPNGSYRRFSFGSVQSSCTSHYDCVQWIYGVTEGGSSGSGLWDTNHRLVGQLYGGASSCSNTTGIDEYGKFGDSYSLISGYLQRGSDDYLEDDDSCGGARLLTPSYYGGLVLKSTDPDWYRIDVPPASRFAATIAFTHANGDIDMALYDGCGGPLVASSTGVGNTETVIWDNVTGVTHSLFLNPYLYSDTRNEYALNVVVAPCGAEDVYEDNDTCGAATFVADGVINSLFVSKTDPDWFALNVYPYSSRDVAIFFTHAVADVDMVAWDSCGGSIVASSTGVTNSEHVSISNPTDTTRVYYVNVYVYGFSSGNCNTYRLDVSLPVCVFDDGLENDDTCETAVPLAPGSYAGLFAEGGDDDWYRIAVPHGSTVTCAVAGSGISLGDLDEHLFDGCGGSEIAFSDSYTNSESVSWTNSGADTEVWVQETLYSGNCVEYTLTVDVSAPATFLGNVGVDAGGGPVDVLFVNGSSGSGPSRTVEASASAAIDLSLVASPYGPASARYAVFVWGQAPTAATETSLPFAIGTMAMSPLLRQCGAACPISAAVTLHTNCGAVRCSTADATGALAPGVVLTLPAGRYAAGQTLFAQGVIRDDSDTSVKRVSITNGVEISIVQ
jgi:trypsin-like peptidase